MKVENGEVVVCRGGIDLSRNIKLETDDDIDFPKSDPTRPTVALGVIRLEGIGGEIVPVTLMFD